MTSRDFVQRLVAKGVLAVEDARRALEHERRSRGRIDTSLIELNLMDEDLLGRTWAEMVGVPYASPDELRAATDDVARLIPAKMAASGRVVSFDRFGTTVSIAMADPGDLTLQDELAFVTGKRIKVHFAPEVRIYEALERHYGYSAAAQFERLWERLNRSRYLWRDEPAVAPPSDSLLDTPPELARPPISPLARSLQERSQEVPALSSAELPDLRPATPPMDLPPRLRHDRRAAKDRRKAAAPPLPRPVEHGQGPAVQAPPREAPVEPLPAARQEPASLPTPPPTTSEPTAQIPAGSVPRSATRVPPAGPPHPSSHAIRTVEELEARVLELPERDDIARFVLDFLLARFQRVALFMVRGGEVAGWMAGGYGVDGSRLGSFGIGLDTPSMFLNLKAGSPFFRGPLPLTPAHQEMTEIWGRELPKECLLLPIRINERLVSAIYCDKRHEGLGQNDVDLALQVAALTGHAFEQFILRRKSG